ncbi:BC85_0335 family putative methyltransferase [Mycoplasma todarodis]|uniref:BC85_0335 family putative methyltransferase n=1 Tax=Mycoplasma todarodis TaxID=1937191 RepID=UPI003B2BF04D
MSSTTRYILIASVFIVLIIGFTVFAILQIKARKLKKVILLEDSKLNENDTNVKELLERTEVGEMIWELKEQIKNPIDDLSMEYLITNIIRNGYKNIWIEGATEGYEAITIVKKTNANVTLLKNSIKDLELFEKLTKEFKVPKTRIKFIEKKLITDKFDFVFLSEETPDFNSAFDNSWVNVSKNGMLIITNCKKPTKDQKDLIKYMKLIGVRFEHQKIHEGFIIAAK